jgi:phage/plasmid-like protein (TIGR03299 family)
MSINLDDFLPANTPASRIARPDPATQPAPMMMKGARDLSGVSRTTSEMLVAAGLNWTAYADEMVTKNDGVAVPTWRAIRRSDTNAVIACARESLVLQQNEETANVLQPLIDAGAATWDTAGCFDGGTRVWFQAKLEIPAEIVKGDWVHTYVVVTNRHDGHGSVKAFLTSVRLVCSNRMRIAEATGALLMSVQHTKTMSERVESAQDPMREIVRKVNAYNDKCRRLANVTMTDEQRTEFLCKLIPAPEVTEESKPGTKAAATRAQKVRDEIARLMTTGKGVEIEGVMGTAWGALNAATEYADHYGYEGDTAEESFDSRNFGTGARFKDHAFETICEYLPARAAN